MSIVHLAYVICDECGIPASEPEDSGKKARTMVPRGWVRAFDVTRARRIDLCPAHAPLAPESGEA